VIKALWALSRNPQLSVAECHQHWFEVHGPHHISKGHRLLGYAQHHTLIPAYEGNPRPTHDGAPVAWLRDVRNYVECLASPAWQAASRDGRSGVHGGRSLFQSPGAFSLAEEKVVVDAPTTPSMVKAIYVTRRNPAVDEATFRNHWFDIHGSLCARVPGLRRYIQNHAVKEAYEIASDLYDGWSELWFDDLDGLQAAFATPEWEETVNDGRRGVRGQPLFDSRSTCLVIGRERFLLRPSMESHT
jgi:uncharacterized protein (TIGR02118 family)